MAKPYDRFVAVISTLIAGNPRLRDGELSGSSAQRALAVTAALDMQIMNGGLMQFFWNCPHLVEHVVPALHRVGLLGLAGHFEKAVEQLAGNLDGFLARREQGEVDDFVAVAGENDFEWFEDLYFGEFDEAADGWSGLVGQVYERVVSFALENLQAFVVGRVAKGD